MPELVFPLDSDKPFTDQEILGHNRYHPDIPAAVRVNPEEIDRLLGCVLTYSDENFNAALERGFASAIRKEWQWRTSRGHDTRNLRAFTHLMTPETERAQSGG